MLSVLSNPTGLTVQNELILSFTSWPSLFFSCTHTQSPRFRVRGLTKPELNQVFEEDLDQFPLGQLVSPPLPLLHHCSGLVVCPSPSQILCRVSSALCCATLTAGCYPTQTFSASPVCNHGPSAVPMNTSQAAEKTTRCAICNLGSVFLSKGEQAMAALPPSRVNTFK